MTPYFPKDTVLDERDRDVAAALGIILTPLPPAAIKVALMPDHPGVDVLSTNELNRRLARVITPVEALLSWGLSYAAYRHSFPREDAPQAPPPEEEQDERFQTLRDRLSSSAQQ